MLNHLKICLNQWLSYGDCLVVPGRFAASLFTQRVVESARAYAGNG